MYGALGVLKSRVKELMHHDWIDNQSLPRTFGLLPFGFVRVAHAVP